MKDPLLEVQQELRARKNRTVRNLFWNPDKEELTVVPVGYNENVLRSSFNVKLGKDWDAKRTADWIEQQLADPDTVPQNRDE